MAKDITFNITGDTSDGFLSNSSLTLKDPTHFKGTIDLNPYGNVVLQGIAADSYSIKGGVLSLYNGSTLLDKISVVPGAFNYFVGGRNSGYVLLDTGRISPGEESNFALSVHT